MAGGTDHVSDALSLRRRADEAATALPALLLAAERLAATVLPGAHGERRAGSGEAFWQYRAAQPGDTATAIDWRRSARSDAVFLREREAQSPRQAALWVDGGAGMAWASDRNLPSKLDRARLLALAFGLALLRGGERVGISGGTARSGHMQGQHLASGLLAPAPQLNGAGLRASQRVVLIGDWLGADQQDLRNFLAHAAGIGAGGALVQILDPVEEVFPFAGAVDFLDSTGNPAHQTRDAEGLRETYLERLAARRAALADMAGGAGWRFGHFTTADPPATALLWMAGALGVM